MKNRWIKFLCVLLMGLICVSMSACQTSEKKADDSVIVDENTDTVEEDETDVESTTDAETVEEADVIEESTMDFDEFVGNEETEQDENVTDTFSEMEAEEEEQEESMEITE